MNVAWLAALHGAFCRGSPPESATALAAISRNLLLSC